MADLRSRLPGQSLMERTLELHPLSFSAPSGEALPWYRGALGEIAVAGVLALLGDEWTVLHSVPIGEKGSDIDHVVIGPPGAFTINTKSSPGKPLWIAGHGLLVDGQKTNYVNKAGFEAERAAQLLAAAVGFTVPVTPLIVFVNPGSRTIVAEPEHGVQVVADSELLDFLHQRRREFNAEQVERIAFTSIRPETWNAPLTSALPNRRVAIQFNAIVARSAQEAQLAPAAVRETRPAQVREARPTGVPAASSVKVRAARPANVGVARPAAAPSTRASRPSQPRPTRRRSKRRQRSSLEPLVRFVVGMGVLWYVTAVVLPAMTEAITP